MRRWAVFVSGSGTNLQNILDLESAGKFKSQKIEVVIADRECAAIERAKKKDKTTLIVSPKEPGHDERVLKFLQDKKVESIFLLGYMRILSANFIQKFGRPIVNLHPSLLPKHKGMHAIQKSFEAKDSEVGVSLHEVIYELDSGKILKQLSFARPPDISLEAFEAKIHSLEKEIVSQYFFDLESNPALR